MMINDNNYVLITGAGGGTGYELARLFAQDGYDLIIAGRCHTDLERIAVEMQQQHNIDVVIFSTDLTDPKNASALYDRIIALQLPVSVLVNSAVQEGFGDTHPTGTSADTDIINLGVTSLTILSKQFADHLVDRGGGKILNVASFAGKIPGHLVPVYYSTCAFISAFSDAIRNTLNGTDVTVTSLLPDVSKQQEHSESIMSAAGFYDEQFKVMITAADVAKEGYDGLMEGRDTVVSGSINVVPATTVHLNSEQSPVINMAAYHLPAAQEK